MSSSLIEKITIQKRYRKRRDHLIDFWAKIPLVLKYFALGTLALTIFTIYIGYWYSKGNRPVFIKVGEPQLSQEVVAVINGYERRVTANDKLQMLVKADREITFSDGRHELENVFVEVHPENSTFPDRIQAEKAVYTPDNANPADFSVNFSGKVRFETRDGLKVETEQISYSKQNETATTESTVNFNRENLTGSALGATFQVKEKQLVLQNQVEINVAPGGPAAQNSLSDFGNSAVKINSTRATFNQDLGHFELDEGVQIIITPQNKDHSETTIRSYKAIYEKQSQKIDLTGGVEIVSGSDNVALISPNKLNVNQKIPVVIRANNAIYEQAINQVNLNGEASVEQGNGLIKGDSMAADLNAQKRLQKGVTRGNSFLRTISAERATEVNSAEMNFQFDDNQQLKNANAVGNIRVHSVAAQNVVDLTDANALSLDFQTTKTQSLLSKMVSSGTTNVRLTANDSVDYSQIGMSAPNSTETLFAVQNERSVLKQMQTGGRTTLTMSPPPAQANNPRATNKRLTADSLKLLWNQSGSSLARAEAAGNAEFFAIPLGSGPQIDKQSLFAAHFDCDFYESNNLLRQFVATTGVKAVLEPTIQSDNRGARNLLADRMVANVEGQTQAIERLDASGNAKFNELDRNGTATNFSYTASDQIVRLRNGQPTVWDNRVRLKAAEIDWNTARNISFARGKVSTVYYSQEQTGGAAPFAKANAPVFVVSNAAEFNHANGTAFYFGDAKAWQDNNYVRAEKLELHRDSSTMYGQGKVQSALYNARRETNHQQVIVPVLATADRIKYSDREKQLRYEGKVDIRQGTERILSDATDVYLDQKREVERTVAQTNVVMTQPGRRATGDWVQYTMVDEVAVFRGRPAIIEDAEQGSTQNQQITVYTRENKIIGEGGIPGKTPGRVRSIHKIKKQ